MVPRTFLGWATFFASHAAIIIAVLGIASVCALQRVKALRNTPIFAIIRVLVLFDVLCITILEIHDLPCELAGQELFGPVFMTISMLAQPGRFFSELLALVIVAFLHLICVYFPIHFRRLTLLHAYGIVVIFIVLGFIITIPLFTACCAFVYHPIGSFWGYDFSKGGSLLFSQLSLGLQATCFVSLLTCDALIIRKIYILRKSRIRLTPSISATVHSSEISDITARISNIGTHKVIIHISRITVTVAKLHMPYGTTTNMSKPNKFERRIAFAFLWLSLSFLIPTIIFNSRFLLQDFFLYGLISKISNLVNYSKFMVYTFSLPSIRRQFFQMFSR